MPGGSHGGGSHGGGGGHHGGSHSSSHNGIRHTYRPVVFYRNGMMYSVNSTRMGNIMNAVGFLIFALVMAAMLFFLAIPGTKEQIEMLEADREYYINLINDAPSENRTKAIWIDYLDGQKYFEKFYDNYDEDNDGYKDSYCFYYHVLKVQETGEELVITKDGVNYSYLYHKNEYGESEKYVGWTYLLYDYDEITSLRNKYINGNELLDVVLSNSIDEMAIDTDCIDTLYKDIPLENDREYQGALKTLRTTKILGGVAGGVLAICLIVIIYNAIPRKNDKKDDTSKEVQDRNDKYNDYNDYRNKQRNAIFEESSSLKTKTCEYCGKEIPENSDRCPFCGSKFM